MKMILNCGIAAIALATAPAVAQTGSAPPAGTTAIATENWEAAGSDIPTDPAWRFGTLPNGLRYAVRRSSQPQGAISVRVRIGVGGLMESDRQQGWSHLLEHMTFRGTRHYADGEGIRLWQRLGASFGSDTNAQTTLTATTYQLDLPRADAASYREAMAVLAEMMDSAAIDPALLATERRVVEAELAQRLSPLTRAIKAAQQPLFYAGTKAAVRDVMGTSTTLANADAASLKAFYEAWYRPDNATVVVAGDAEPALLEAEVKRAFGGWKREVKAPPAPNWGAPTTPVPPTALVVDALAPDTFALDFVAPHPEQPMTVSRQQQQLVELIAIGILNQRLVAAARKDDAIVNAGAQWAPQRHVEDQLIVSVQPKPGAWSKALDQVYGVLNTASGRPPSEAEIDEQANAITSKLKQQVASASTDTAATLANSVVTDVEAGDVTGAPAYYVALFNAQRKGLTPAIVAATMKRLLAPAPRLLVLGSKPVEGGNAAVTAALGTAEKVAGAATEQLRSVSFDQLVLAGAPATVAATTPITELDAERVRLSNGVEIVLKRTGFEKDRIRVRVSVGGGILAQRFDEPGLWWTAPALPGSGVGPFNAAELARVVAGRQVAFAAQPGLEGLALTSTTNAADLGDALKLLTAEVAQPRFDAAVISRMREAVTANYASVFTQPLSTFAALGGTILHGGDGRFQGLPSQAEIAGLTLPAFRSFWSQRLAQGPVRVTIVGDVDRARAIDAVARTVGTLPPRPAAAPIRTDLPFPRTAKPMMLHHRGDPGQAVVVRTFGTLGYDQDQREGDALDVAAAIVQARLIEGFREREGGSYTPFASHEQSPPLSRYGAFLAGAQVRTDQVDAFSRSLAEVLGDLAAKGPSADEFKRAQTTVASARTRMREDNGWWLNALGGDLSSTRIEVTATGARSVEAVTPAMVRAVAAKYLKPDDALVVEVLPEAGSTKGAAEEK